MNGGINPFHHSLRGMFYLSGKSTGFLRYRQENCRKFQRNTGVVRAFLRELSVRDLAPIEQVAGKERVLRSRSISDCIHAKGKDRGQ